MCMGVHACVCACEREGECVAILGKMHDRVVLSMNAHTSHTCGARPYNNSSQTTSVVHVILNGTRKISPYTLQTDRITNWYTCPERMQIE